MITQDPEKRTRISSQIIDILAEKAPPEDKNLVRSFAPVILAEASDRNLFLLQPEIMAERLLRHLIFSCFNRRLWRSVFCVILIS